MNAEWDARFEPVVRASLPLLAAGQPLDPSASLFSLGLDSMGTIQLLLELEETFEITVPDEHLTAETFATATTLWTVVSKLSNTTSSH